jgi:gamma-glutamyl hydrolase
MVNKLGLYYSHHWGVLPETYNKVAALKDFFKVTSVSKDAEDLYYIGSIEAYDFPIYAYQFHTEVYKLN